MNTVSGGREGGALSPSNRPGARQCPFQSPFLASQEQRKQALSPLDTVYFATGLRGRGFDSRAPPTHTPACSHGNLDASQQCCERAIVQLGARSRSHIACRGREPGTGLRWGTWDFVIRVWRWGVFTEQQAWRSVPGSPSPLPCQLHFSQKQRKCQELTEGTALLRIS